MFFLFRPAGSVLCKNRNRERSLTRLTTAAGPAERAMTQGAPGLALEFLPSPCNCCAPSYVDTARVGHLCVCVGVGAEVCRGIIRFQVSADMICGAPKSTRLALTRPSIHDIYLVGSTGGETMAEPDARL